MKREIREVDAARGTVQITTASERWYARRILVGTPDEQWEYVPSVTWICDEGMAKGIEFFRWLANKGWSEAEQIRIAAGDKGGKVHQAIAVLVNGGTVAMDDDYQNPHTLEPEPLTPEEYLCLMSFCEWFREYKPEIVANEYTVWNERYHYAGTVDLRCKIDGVTWLVDFTISSQIWPSKRIQVAAYRHADPTLPKRVKLGVLQLEYKYNKSKKWKFSSISDEFQLFLAARKIWADKCADVKPLQRDYPLSLSLGLPESAA